MKRFFLYFSIALLSILVGCSDGDILSDLGGGKKIYYTTTDGKKIQFGPFSGTFDAVLVSNIYDNGKGCLTFDEKVTIIGEVAFMDCNNLLSIKIPNSVTSIGGSAFYKCTSLTSITIPDSVTEIGDNVFRECSNLTSITIPDSVTSIGEYAFIDCSSLAEFKGKFASSDGRCLIVDGLLHSFAPAGLNEYTIPDSVTSIGEYAFYYCTSLTSITIPDSVTSIEQNTFYGCSSLASITIPDSVTEIGYYAFVYCTSLKEVYCKPTTPPTAIPSTGSYPYWHSFDDNAADRKIYVPAESVEVYKTAEWWGDYANNIEGYDFE